MAILLTDITRLPNGTYVDLNNIDMVLPVEDDQYHENECRVFLKTGFEVYANCYKELSKALDEFSERDFK